MPKSRNKGERSRQTLLSGPVGIIGKIPGVAAAAPAAVIAVVVSRLERLLQATHTLTSPDWIIVIFVSRNVDFHPEQPYTATTFACSGVMAVVSAMGTLP